MDKKGLPCHGLQDKTAAGTRAMYAPYISEDLCLCVSSLLYVGVSVETIMQRQERSIRRSTYELDADDAASINMWVESHQNNVFFLGIQTEWRLQQMIRFGNRGLVASGSRFGTNKLKACLYVCMCHFIMLSLSIFIWCFKYIRSLHFCPSSFM